ncbi:hypothetical protein M408DRAFT_25066 [Serendipita vermifera MAFF 305830]|uniref:F-box domain-containing protein n=1 Tax=Serendipita vermifera MAFF 305830 TaxID=933852 RepID=A0A0C3B5P1_SERVB|nr:hypothetical protein M408DRAFT_25066 [Serendipita vermifera MAFF 305830]
MHDLLLLPNEYIEFVGVPREISGQLESLRSLSITVVSPSLLDIVSELFPRLTHLNLWMDFETRVYPPIPNDEGIIGKGALKLKKLEVLTLCPVTGFLNLSSCSLPRLHTLYCGSFLRRWHTHISPFVHTHGSRIKVLDLDNFTNLYPSSSSSSNLILPLGFWELVPRLELLRIGLGHTTFVELPNKDHPLEWLIDIDETRKAEQFVDAVGIWARRGDKGGPSQITLNADYVRMIDPGDVGGEVGTILHGLKQHGTVLVDKAGKPFEYRT